jgi:membrane associated rhomboid family serine protease
MNAFLHHLSPYAHQLLAEKPLAYLAWPTIAMGAGLMARYSLGKSSQRLAIVPRTTGGLVGIATAPFLHANLAHLFANIAPFVVLAALVLRKGPDTFLETFAAVALGSGALVWLLARKGAHMGASGVVFGLFGYLVSLAYVTRATGDLLVAGLVVLVYGGLLLGLKPARRETSWEAHLFGLLVGVAKAVWLGR